MSQVRTADAGQGAGPLDELVVEFAGWLDGQRGLAPVTVQNYCWHAEQFLGWLSPHVLRSMGLLDAGMVTAFMVGVLPGSERELGEVDGKVGAFVPEVRACDGTNIDRLVGCCSLVVWLAFGVAAAIGACGGPGAPVGSRRRRAPHGHGPA